MKMDSLQQSIDLRRADIDPEVFASALAVKHVHALMANAGSALRHPDLETALQPHHIEAFLVRAIETAKKTKRFEHEWQWLQQFLPGIEMAWEKGQALFQEDLSRAMESHEAIEYLSQIDFAEDCYASVAALKTYPHDRALQAWCISRYMLAWHQHFLADDRDSP